MTKRIVVALALGAVAAGAALAVMLGPRGGTAEAQAPKGTTR